MPSWRLGADEGSLFSELPTLSQVKHTNIIDSNISLVTQLIPESVGVGCEHAQLRIES